MNDSSDNLSPQLQKIVDQQKEMVDRLEKIVEKIKQDSEENRIKHREAMLLPELVFLLSIIAIVIAGAELRSEIKLDFIQPLTYTLAMIILLLIVAIYAFLKYFKKMKRFFRKK